MSDYRVQVTVEVDVTGAASESQARQTVFSLLGTPQPISKGRPVSGPRAVVTGISIANRLEDENKKWLDNQNPVSGEVME